MLKLWLPGLQEPDGSVSSCVGARYGPLRLRRSKSPGFQKAVCLTASEVSRRVWTSDPERFNVEGFDIRGLSFFSSFSKHARGSKGSKLILFHQALFLPHCPSEKGMITKGNAPS